MVSIQSPYRRCKTRVSESSLLRWVPLGVCRLARRLRPEQCRCRSVKAWCNDGEKMSLAVVHYKPDNSHATPIVLLHGAWHGAWTWDNGFVDRLVDGGFEVLALSLRGHGNSGDVVDSHPWESVSLVCRRWSRISTAHLWSLVIRWAGSSPSVSLPSSRWWVRSSWRQ